MPTITPGKTSNAIDRNATSADRKRRNWQRLTQGAATRTLAVDGVNIGFNAEGQLTLVKVLILNEIPGGTIDGTNATFMLGNPPIDGTLLVSVDGVQMVENNDYTVSGNTFTFVSGAIPMTGDSIRITYET